MTDQQRTHQAGPRRGLRRAATVLAMSAVVAVGATACQVQPGAAAFVGDQRFTQNQVESIFQSIRDSYGSKLAKRNFPDVRQAVTKDLVIRDLSQRIARRDHLKVDTPPYATLAKQFSLPKDNKYVHLEAQTQAYVKAIRDHASTKKLRTADLQEIRRSLIQSGADPRQVSVKQLRQGLPAAAGKVVAVRDELRAAVHRYHVDVNPRYGKLDYALTVVALRNPSTGQPLVGSLSIPLGGGSPDVVKTQKPNPLQG